MKVEEQEMLNAISDLQLTRILQQFGVPQDSRQRIIQFVPQYLPKILFAALVTFTRHIGDLF